MMARIHQAMRQFLLVFGFTMSPEQPFSPNLIPGAAPVGLVII
jgi:hypothetical protein